MKNLLWKENEKMYYLNILLIVQLCCSNVLHTKQGESLQIDPKRGRIKELCGHRQAICESKDKNICAVRDASKLEYMDFNNSCFLFMANMCEHPGKEYSIVSSGSCLQYVKTRRTQFGTPSASNVKPVLNKTVESKTTMPTTFQTLYEVDTAFDYHICPMSCPDVYSPVCVGVNRGFGMYFKFYTFANHCLGDLYYCQNWREFSPPPEEDETVRSSPLSWSFCAANRYIQFARFSELTSSMGHYGWLAGDYKPSHIIEPRERDRGFG